MLKKSNKNIKVTCASHSAFGVSFLMYGLTNARPNESIKRTPRCLPSRYELKVMLMSCELFEWVVEDLFTPMTCKLSLRDQRESRT